MELELGLSAGSESSWQGLVMAVLSWVQINCWWHGRYMLSHGRTPCDWCATLVAQTGETVWSWACLAEVCEGILCQCRAKEVCQ